MSKKKTSILFINSDGQQKRMLHIPSYVLLHWKKYLIVSSVLFAVLITVLGFMVYDKTSEYYTLMYKERLTRANRIKNMIDIKKAKASFESIDSTMLEINSFLEKRGLTHLKLKNAGGLGNFEITDINDAAQFYDEHLEQIKNLVKITPMGLPHVGKITSRFGIRHNPFTGRSVERHGGLDFRGAVGSPILVTADGVVKFAATNGGFGKCVIVEHKNGFETLYAHLSKINVKKGQKIKLGTKIGKLGSTGRSTGPHLHYEIHKDGEKIDPELFIKIN